MLKKIEARADCKRGEKEGKVSTRNIVKFVRGRRARFGGPVREKEGSRGRSPAADPSGGGSQGEKKNGGGAHSTTVCG